MISRLSALLLVLCGGCPSVEAPAIAAAEPWGIASIVRGSYVSVGEACSNPSAVFRYHGWNIGWIRRGSGPGGRYSIHRVRERPEEYVGTLFAPGPGAEGDPDPSEADISITAVGDGERIVVRTAERVVMRICPEDALPVWGRERPVFMQYLPGKAPVALDAPSGGILTQRAQCLGVIGEDGRFATAVWPATARIEFDAPGLVVVDGEGAGRVRLGDYVQFTGGRLPRGTQYPLGGEVHVVDMPMACAHYPGYDGWIAIVNAGFRKGRHP